MSEEETARPLGASLRWNRRRSQTLREALAEIEAAGFDGIELCGVTEAEVADVVTTLDAARVRVFSIHAPCPDQSTPSRLYPGDWLASLDPNDFRAALMSAEQSLRFAASIGVECVVFHLGRVTVGEHLYHQLARAVAEASPLESRLRATYRVERSTHEGPHLDRVRDALERLLTVADTLGVLVCIELRYRFEQIPNAADAAALLVEFDGGPLRYWHDTGHASVQQHLGLLSCAELAPLVEVARGAHLHDAVGTDDHRAPGAGDIDFRRVLRELHKEAVLTFELDRNISLAEARASVDFTRRCLAGGSHDLG